MSQSNTNSNTVKMASYAQLERLMRLLEDVLVPPQQKSFVRKYLANRNKTMRGASIVIQKTIQSKGQQTYKQQVQEQKEMEEFVNEGEQMGFGV